MTRLPRPEQMPAFRYADAGAPTQYHCGQCGVLGVKLWRKYQTFLDHQSLLCASCACAEQSRDGKSYTIEQSYVGNVSVTRHYDAILQPELSRAYGGSDTSGDQIGWRIPAVPTEDGTTYWGYRSQRRTARRPAS